MGMKNFVCFRQYFNSREAMGEIPIQGVPFEHVAVDIVGPFPRAMGYKHLLTYICLSSRYPEAVPLKTATAIECDEVLVDIFARNVVPDTLLSDWGGVNSLCKRLGINQLRTTPYHP